MILAQLRVLVVDDDLNVRKIVKAVLFGLGIKDVVEAPEGRSALEQLKTSGVIRKDPKTKRKYFDFVVCDWMMPVMTGIELLKAVREDRNLAKLPFLMLTAENDHENVSQAIQLGVSDYIVKPFTAEILENKIISITKKLP